MGGSSKKPKPQTVGYRYSYKGFDVALCHGELTKLRAVYYGDKPAWRGELVKKGPTAERFQVDNQGLFGGEMSEGGIYADVHFLFGSMDQDAYGGRRLPGDSWIGFSGRVVYLDNRRIDEPTLRSNYKGIAVAMFRQFYFGTSAYMKDLAFEVERYWDGWYPQVAQVGLDSNPAHIIYECLTNGEWGLGYDTELIDDAAFRAAALALYNEGFGLSLAWADQTSVEDFVNEILSHIDGDIFFDQNSGKWRLKLIRGSDPVVYPFSPENCVVTSFTRKAVGEVVNQLYVRYVSRDTEEFVSVAIQDLASIEAQGGTASTTRDYRGIRDENLALRVCQRDLQSISATLATVELVANRGAWSLMNGDVVTLSWPAHKIQSLRLRVTAVTYSDSESGDIKFTLIEDVFGQVDGVFGEGSAPGGGGGTGEATPFDVVAAWEPPYWYVIQALGEVDTDPLTGSATVLVSTKNPAFRSVDVFTGVPDSTEDPLTFRVTGPQTPTGVLSSDLPREVSSQLRISMESMLGVDEGISLDSLAIIGTGVDAELVWITSTTESGPVVLRGMLDTQPREWPAGTRVFFVGAEAFPADTSEWPLGTPLTYRVLMQTGSDTTPLDKAQSVSTVIAARQGRPLLPANIRLNGELWAPFAEATPANTLEVSWSSRNRLLQTTSTMDRWDGGGIPAETGSTVTAVLRQFGAVVDRQTGVVASSVTFPLDNVVSGPVTVELYAERDGLRSYQTFEHSMQLAVGSTVEEWPAVPFPGTRAALIGDSITHQNTLHVPGSGLRGRFEQYGFSVVGYWTNAMAMLNHPLELEPGIQPDLNGRKQGLNVAIAGSRVMNWWSPSYDNQGDGVLDKGPMYTALKNINAFDVAVMMGGTNDLAFNRTASQVLADLKRAVVALASKGKWVFLLTITPRTTDLLRGYTASQQAVIRDRLLQVNQGLQSWVQTSRPNNVWLVDAFAAAVGPNGIDPAGLVSSLVDPDADSVPGNYRVDDPGVLYAPDGLHLGSAGAAAVGRALAGVMRVAGVPDRVPGKLGPLELGPNVLPNPTFVCTSTRPAGGKSSVLGRALGLGPARIDAAHAPGLDSYSNVGLGYQNGPMPDYWFFYRASNTDNESNSNFGEYMWSGMVNEYPKLRPYMAESSWADGSAKTSLVNVDGRPGLRIDFRTPVTGNKNEAFVVRAFIPRGQHGPWDSYNDGVILVPNDVYAPGDRLSAEAEVRLSNVHGLHTAIMTLEFQSVDLEASAGGDYSTAGSLISGAAYSANFFPPDIIDVMRFSGRDVTLQMHSPVVVAPTPAPTENHQYARLNFQFSCDASTQAASVTVIIVAPTVNKVSELVFPPALPDKHGLGNELGQNLGGAQP